MNDIPTTVSDVCSECPGRCCTNRRWQFYKVELTMREAEHPALKEHVAWHQNPDDPKRKKPWIVMDPKCPLLGRDNRCTVYEDRPAACRSYMCFYEPDIMKTLEKYPTHLRLLNKWKVLPGQAYGLDGEGMKEAEAFVAERDKPP